MVPSLCLSIPIGADYQNLITTDFPLPLAAYSILILLNISEKC